MDHLPIPEHCSARQMTVPYLGLVKFDRLGYFDFLKRLGYSGDRLLKMLNDEATRPFAEGTLQEWLYFRLLHHFSDACGAPLDLDSFISEDENGMAVVSSKLWPTYLATLPTAGAL